MAEDAPNGKFLRHLAWAAGGIVAIVVAAFSTASWGDDRYAPKNDHVTRSEFKVTDHRVQRLEEDLREIRADTKEILRRLPK